MDEPATARALAASLPRLPLRGRPAPSDGAVGLDAVRLSCWPVRIPTPRTWVAARS